MKEYKVITHQAPPEIANLVNQALKEGWQLIGGVSITSVPKEAGIFQIIYSQALAR
jgi:hypothetical protein